jgi:hypothetical protein
VYSVVNLKKPKEKNMDTVFGIHFDRENMTYQPGGQLGGQITYTATKDLSLKRAEVSVLWYTSGKGDQDMSVISLDTSYEDSVLPAGATIPFQAALPDSPRSYDGTLLKIHWVVRIRVFPQGGSDFGAEAEFLVAPAPAS